MPVKSESTWHEASVVLPAHLHARPAGQLVRAVARFSAEVRLSHRNATVDARGILAVLGLGATAGETVIVQASGLDAHAAVAALVSILVDAS
jgi:phosphotransferase system HPr (HPr) family protein